MMSSRGVPASVSASVALRDLVALLRATQIEEVRNLRATLREKPSPRPSPSGRESWKGGDRPAVDSRGANLTR